MMSFMNIPLEMVLVKWVYIQTVLGYDMCVPIFNTIIDIKDRFMGAGRTAMVSLKFSRYRHDKNF